MLRAPARSARAIWIFPHVDAGGRMSTAKRAGACTVGGGEQCILNDGEQSRTGKLGLDADANARRCIEHRSRRIWRRRSNASMIAADSAQDIEPARRPTRSSAALHAATRADARPACDWLISLATEYVAPGTVGARDPATEAQLKSIGHAILAHQSIFELDDLGATRCTDSYASSVGCAVVEMDQVEEFAPDQLVGLVAEMRRAAMTRRPAETGSAGR